MNVTRGQFYFVAALISVVFVASVVGGAAYLESRVAMGQAQQAEKDAKPIHQQQEQRQEQAKESETVNQAQLAATLKAMQAQRQQPIQPVDYNRIAAMIEQRLGAKAEVKADATLPNAPSVSVPAKSLRDYILDCDATTASLTSCRASVKNVTEQLDAEKVDHAATKQEMQTYKAAAKGTFWGRAKSKGKWLVIGGALGAAGAAIAKH